MRLRERSEQRNTFFTHHGLISTNFLKELTFDERELRRELWRYLRDDVRREVAPDEGGVAHHVVDGVGHLDQLARGEV